MEKLPLLISVPHAGLQIPPEVETNNLLTSSEIVQDGDEGAANIYGTLENHVQHFITTNIARAFVDLNRAEDDIRKDGIVKTHTCWDVPIYKQELTHDVIQQLITRYHRPYHEQLTALAKKELILAIDCHTMAEYGPPVGPDVGVKRPLVCLGNMHGKSCPDEWLEQMANCFEQQFASGVAINEPFSGGYITQNHGREMPWMQLELSRSSSYSENEKSVRVLKALQCWNKLIVHVGHLNKKHSEE
ncbi:MAG: N-formylglutamate amidohydrolase [Gammaproteobacteria bacterium]